MTFLLLQPVPVLKSLTKIRYFTLCNYSPRGHSELSIKSRNVCGGIKAGRINIINSAIERIDDLKAEEKEDFFNDKITLVPVPRSAPLTQGALWPAKEIVNALLEANLGKDHQVLIKRIHHVKKSSSQVGADQRPSVEDHYNSLSVQKYLMKPERITLIDDVLTLGRTFFACAQRLYESFPEIEIRCCSLIRTQSLIPDIEKLLDPSFGDITYNNRTGKTTRNP